MAKFGIGKILALGAVAGVAAIGVSYYKKYQKFNRDLDEDFHEFEGADDTPVPDSTMNRNYVSLHADKDELIVAAGDMLHAAKNVVKDAAAIVVETTKEMVSVATDPTNNSKESAKDFSQEVDDVPEDMDILEDAEDTLTVSEDVVDTIVSTENLTEESTIITEEADPT